MTQASHQVDHILAYIDALAADPTAAPPPELDAADVRLAQALVRAYSATTTTPMQRDRIWRRAVMAALARRAGHPESAVSSWPSNGRLHEEHTMTTTTTTLGPTLDSPLRPTPRRIRRSGTGRGRWTLALVASIGAILVLGAILLARGTRSDPGSPASLGILLLTESQTPTPTPLLVTDTDALPDSVRLEGITWEAQGWNNQGPATLAMALSYYDSPFSQTVIANRLKPHPEDKYVGPYELATFVDTYTDLRALMRRGGDRVMLQRVLAAGLPVIVEIGFRPEGEDWLGHYVLLMGYEGEHFLVYDSYLGSGPGGEGRPYAFSAFEADWKQLNRSFLVIYEPEHEGDLRQALGGVVDPSYAAAVILREARAASEADPGDVWAWLNLGAASLALGEYDYAAAAYDQAFDLDIPWRYMWYVSDPYEAYYRAGRFDDMIMLANSVENTTPYVEEAYYWHGLALAAQGRVEEASAQFQRAIQANVNYAAAREALVQLEDGTLPQPLAQGVTPTPALAWFPGTSTPVLPTLLPTVVPPDANMTWSPDVTSPTPQLITPLELTTLVPTAIPAAATATAIVQGATATALQFATPTPIPSVTSTAIMVISPTPTASATATSTPTPTILPQPGSIVIGGANVGSIVARGQYSGVALSDMVWSPDGRWVAFPAVDDDAVVVLVDVTDLDHAPRRLGGHTPPVSALAFSPDGSLLASGDADGAVHFWDTARGSERAPLIRAEGAITGLAFNPAGTILVIETAEGVALWFIP